MVQGFSSFYILSLEVNILLEQYEIIHRFQGETANTNLNAQNCFGLIESDLYERKWKILKYITKHLPEIVVNIKVILIIRDL